MFERTAPARPVARLKIDMHTRSVRLWQALVAAIVFAATPAWAEVPAWLLGEWELKSGDARDPKDSLDFHEGGQVISTSAKGGQAFGAYFVRATEIRVAFVQRNGNALPLVFVPSGDKRELQVRSERTGKVAVYAKKAR